jgi:hypothetical protein
VLRIATFGVLCVAMAVTLVSALGLSAQQAKDAIPGPVPAQIPAAKKVFIANGGVDGTALEACRRAGEPDQPYNHLYAAMKGWGRYELVDFPADADLVFEISFTAPSVQCGTSTCYGPQLGLAILDRKTHFKLWTITEPVEGAIRKATWLKNFDQAMTTLVEDIKHLDSQPKAPESTQK